MPKPKPKPKSPDRKPLFLPLPNDFNPQTCTFDEACSYARHGRWYGFEKLKNGRWDSFKDGRRRMIIFASVKADEARMIAASRAAQKKNGRPKKVLPQAVAAE